MGSCGTWGPSEISVCEILEDLKGVLDAHENQRHPHHWIDRLHGALVVIRERPHAASLLRSHRTSHEPRYWRWNQDAGNWINWRIGTQLGHQERIRDPCIRVSHNANCLHDGMINLITHSLFLIYVVARVGRNAAELSSWTLKIVWDRDVNETLRTETETSDFFSETRPRPIPSEFFLRPRFWLCARNRDRYVQDRDRCIFRDLT